MQLEKKETRRHLNITIRSIEDGEMTPRSTGGPNKVLAALASALTSV
jgi:hypothetical protein